MRSLTAISRLLIAQINPTNVPSGASSLKYAVLFQSKTESVTPTSLKEHFFRDRVVILTYHKRYDDSPLINFTCL